MKVEELEKKIDVFNNYKCANELLKIIDDPNLAFHFEMFVYDGTINFSSVGKRFPKDDNLTKDIVKLIREYRDKYLDDIKSI